MTDERDPDELYSIWRQAEEEGASAEVLNALYDTYSDAAARRDAVYNEGMEEAYRESTAIIQADQAARVAEGVPTYAVAVDAQWSPKAARLRLGSKPKVRRKPEAEVVTEGIALLNTLAHTYAWKIHGGAHGQVGQPDVDGCSRGRSLKFEAKTTGTKPAPHQLGVLKRWAETGALVGWFRTNDHVRELMAHLDDPDYVPNLDNPGCGRASCPLHGKKAS